MEQFKKKALSLLMKAVMAVAMIALVTTAAPLTAQAKSSQPKPAISEKKVTLLVTEIHNLSVNNRPAGKTIKWKTSNKKVVTVDQSGRIQGVKVGSAKVTAKIGKKSYTCKVTVKAGLDQKTAELTIGDSKTVKLLGTKIKKVKSYDESVATIDKEGIVTAVGVGETKVRLTGKNNKKYDCAVTVTPLLTVSFETNGGTAVSPQTMKPGATAKKPSVPEKDGYLFDDWYTDAACTNSYNFRTPVTADITLYAKWLVLYEITFDSNGGSKVQTAKVAEGRRVSLPITPTKDDLAFDKWCTDKELKNEYDFSTPVTGSFTLYARWKPVFTVSFETDGGTDIKNVKVSENGTLKQPADPTKDGFKFGGWYADQACTVPYDFTAPVTENTKLYVKWLNIYEITFDSKGGTAVKSQNVTEGQCVTEPETAPTKARYLFTKWYKDAGCTQEYDFALPVTGAFTLYAGWREKPFTRGEWVSALAGMVSMNLNTDVSDIDYYFEDTEGNDNAVAIETAQAYGILPVDENLDPEDVPAFNPDDEATREFAMYTAVRAMGFYDGQETENTNNWSDWDDIKYKNEAMLADKFGFCVVENDTFDPDKPVLNADAVIVAEKIEELYESDTIKEDEQKEIVQQKTSANIKDLRTMNYTNAEFSYIYQREADGRTFVTASGTQVGATVINVDDLLVLPKNTQNPKGLGVKVKNVSTDNETGVTTIETTSPEIDELFDQIDLAQIVPADSIKNAVPVAADGVTVRVITPNAQGNEQEEQNEAFSESADQYDLHIDKDKHFAPPAEFEFDLGDGIDLGHGAKVKGSVTVGIPDINVKIKGDLHLIGSKFDEVLFTMTENVKIEGGLEMTFAESGNQALDSFVPGRKELGRVPIPLGNTGLSIDIVFFYTYSVKGEVNISYSFDVTEGFHYQNGSTRGVFDFRDSLDALNIKAEAKFGLGVAADLTFLEIWDLIGYKIEGGVALSASFTAHVIATDTLLCGDVTLYAYFEHGLDTDTIIGEWLKEKKHTTVKWEVLKNDAENPYKLKLHVENGQRVNECTFGRGELTGLVKDADTGLPLARAQIQLFDAYSTVAVRSKTTGADGKFAFDNLAPGDYKVMVKATGYMQYETDTKVEKNSTKFLETPLMINRDNADGTPRTVSGSIMNGIIRDQYVDDVHYVLTNIRTGVKEGEGDITGHSYSFSLKPGNYRLTVTKTGFLDRTIRLVVSGSSATGGNVVMVPSNYQYQGELEGEMRVVLTWGEKPRDVDSHIFGPTSNGSRFHVFFANKNYYENEQLLVNLDVDDTSSYGPETTTVVKLRDSGKYSFYLHDYSNKSNSSSQALSYSDARVYLYFGDVLYDMYAIPEGYVGTTWHVFDYDAATHSVSPKNIFYGGNPADHDRADTYNAPADGDDAPTEIYGTSADGTYPVGADETVYADILEINRYDDLKKAG